MSEDERDDQREENESPPENGAEEQAPPPRTAAGRARKEAEAPPPEEGEEKGITEDVEGLEAELSAEIGDRGEGDGEAEAARRAEAEGEPEAGRESEPEPDAADEQEEPPHESEFEEDGDGDAEEADAKSGETVETDTLVAADREAEQEAAHAGLKARAEKTAAERVGVTGVRTALGEAAAAGPAGTGDPPKRTMGWRFVAAAVLTVAAVATATSVAFLVYLDDIGDRIGKDKEFSEGVIGDQLSEVEGDEQTILILGSDKRSTAPGDPGRSDTTMLLRVDPDKNFLALLSLPRDLWVEIPGYGEQKLNAAYSFGEQFESKKGERGGPGVTLETVKELLGIDINHIVNIDFSGFYKAVNAIGCVYVDVDRHYYNPEGGDYDDIDIEAGYTQLCGYEALDYVRYRHNDNDIVRGARQQQFLSQARQQIPPRSLLPPPFGDAELIDIFTDYTTSDIDSAPTIVEMLRSFVDVRDAPVRQVDLENTFDTIGGASVVISTKDQIDAAVDQFLGKDLEEAAPPEEIVEPDPEKKKDKKKKDEEPAEPAMIDVTGTTLPMAEEFEKDLDRDKAKLPVFYPTAIPDKPSTAVTQESRGGFTVAVGGPNAEDVGYRAYKFVVSFLNGDGGYTAYYGVSGTNWKDPPILNNPSETREIDGDEYMLFYDRDRLRLVGWKTSKGSYWVSNTLTGALSEDEMLAVAAATKELDG